MAEPRAGASVHVMPTSYLAVFVVFLGTSALACADKPPASSPANSGTSSAAKASGPHLGDTVAIDAKVQEKCALPRVEERPTFEFDSSSVTEREKPVLAALARCLTEGALRGQRLRLVGRADPRGEVEYNMSLGSSRAEAVAAYLRSLGVTNAQLGITSRGELDARGHDERTWAEDRRVDVSLAPRS